MKSISKAIIFSLFAVAIIAFFQESNASFHVKANHSNATITLSQTVGFTVEANEHCNFTWYCDGVAVQSEWAAYSNYAFIPKTLGTLKIQLATNGVILPGPADSVTVRVIAEPAPTPTQTLPILPHATYHSGDSFTTVYFRNITAQPSNAKPPKVTILSPANYSSTTTNNLTLAFDLTATASSGFHPDSFTAHYTTSWEPNHNISIASEVSNASIILTGIPDGQQWIRVYATALSGENETGRENVTKPNSPDSIIIGKFLYIYSDAIGISDYSSVNFTIDTSKPIAQPEDDSDKDSGRNFLLCLCTTAIVAVLALAFLMWRHRK
ncbi:TPA: hypothetical protein HA273_01905 [Candidatus Bathyarchaeota archaeon]|nr:hypothetical protein [Candidatus Bathyarchaeota archaeon]